MLSRALAHAGHYPAIDVLASVSRLVTEIVDSDTRSAGHAVRQLMATYKDKADLISIGAYQAGSDPLTDAAIAARAPIDAFLRQSVEEASTAEEAEGMLAALATLSGSVEVVSACRRGCARRSCGRGSDRRRRTPSPRRASGRPVTR